MSAYSELILFVVNLTVNLLLFGLFIAGGVAVSFDLIKNAAPRLRFALAVAAFLLAAFFPVLVTLNGSTGLETIFEEKQNGGANAFNDNFDDQNSVIKSESNSPAPKSEAEKPSLDLLNNSTTLIADSFIGTLIFIVWVFVSAAFLLKDITAHRRLKKARLLWREATNSEQAELALPDDIPLYFGEEGPATVGFLRPVIVLPERFPDDLSLAAKRFVVQHELAHARWRDPLVNCFLRLIRGLFWVSPALWMLERIAAAERESAADYAAIIKGSASESEYEATALNYATTLVSVAKHFSSPMRRGSLRANSIGLSGHGSRLENRVRLLLTRSPETVRFRLFLASMIFAGSLTGMLFMPVAFQAQQTDDGTEAVIIDDRNSEKPPDNDDLRNSQAMSRRNEVPRVIEMNRNKEEKIKPVAIKQNENQPREITVGAGETVEIPQLIFRQSKQNGTFNKNADDGSREALMRKPSREDAKNIELRQNLSELSDNLQLLDDAKRNLGNDMFRMRQKAAADAEAKMRRTRAVVNTN